MDTVSKGCSGGAKGGLARPAANVRMPQHRAQTRARAHTHTVQLVLMQRDPDVWGRSTTAEGDGPGSRQGGEQAQEGAEGARRQGEAEQGTKLKKTRF